MKRLLESQLHQSRNDAVAPSHKKTPEQLPRLTAKEQLPRRRVSPLGRRRVIPQESSDPPNQDTHTRIEQGRLPIQGSTKNPSSLAARRDSRQILADDIGLAKSGGSLSDDATACGPKPERAAELSQATEHSQGTMAKSFSAAHKDDPSFVSPQIEQAVADPHGAKSSDTDNQPPNRKECLTGLTFVIGPMSGNMFYQTMELVRQHGGAVHSVTSCADPPRPWYFLHRTVVENSVGVWRMTGKHRTKGIEAEKLEEFVKRKHADHVSERETTVTQPRQAAGDTAASPLNDVTPDRGRIREGVQAGSDPVIVGATHSRSLPAASSTDATSKKKQSAESVRSKDHPVTVGGTPTLDGSASSGKNTTTNEGNGSANVQSNVDQTMVNKAPVVDNSSTFHPSVSGKTTAAADTPDMGDIPATMRATVPTAPAIAALPLSQHVEHVLGKQLEELRVENEYWTKVALKRARRTTERRGAAQDSQDNPQHNNTPFSFATMKPIQRFTDSKAKKQLPSS
ncbi:hypothetical protein BAUCODRAFT_124325 [Baudoinia panamericana UAMH 10762]|uniref:BRCT domain-containing protein n=1 Tax=Baudoinia panamericana (strain UAMH 10762) TaxID=717646 RepID=M2LKD2_BAUPA|nr:uncharacterized protein BAUCODRAFT_124325 [Baudoinia panamericana UAMH 10762]EMC94727.1 hypothetical protein BAUCODRAFT_124325 [Baudoinia panamericana UAMH 10762]